MLGHHLAVGQRPAAEHLLLALLDQHGKLAAVGREIRSADRRITRSRTGGQGQVAGMHAVAQVDQLDPLVVSDDRHVAAAGTDRVAVLHRRWVEVHFRNPRGRRPIPDDQALLCRHRRHHTVRAGEIETVDAAELGPQIEIAHRLPGLEGPDPNLALELERDRGEVLAVGLIASLVAPVIASRIAPTRCPVRRSHISRAPPESPFPNATNGLPGSRR